MKANIGKYIKNDKPFSFNLNKLIKHFVAFGGSGSGKTVFSKVIIEEAALNKIPAIIVDPQGDLASLALPDNEIFKNIKVAIFTPASSKGIPLCINPLKMPQADIDREELISILNSMANSVCGLIGYDLEKDKGKHVQAITYNALEYTHRKQINLKDFNELIEILKSEELKDSEFYDDKIVKELTRKLKYLTVGENELLFNHGVQLDIDTLLGKNKDQISVIYLNSLKGSKEKEFFISVLALQLYEWMLKNPSKTLQALFFIDEIADYIPAGSLKPATKDILKLIYKQARKYGVGCLVSTQNPGDIDYKAFAQFGTWAIGRLTTKQDREKVKEAMKSLAGNKIDDLILKMPKLKPGEFLFFCPDEFEDIQEIKSRWLYTKHETLTEEQVKEIMKDTRKEYEFKEKVSNTTKSREEIKKATSKHRHINVKIKGEELEKIINKNKKKLFILFGPEKEKLINKELNLIPIFKTKIRLTTKTFLGKQKFHDLNVCFDAINGNIVIIKKGYATILKGIDKLLNLNERELILVKTLARGKEKTNAELGTASGLTDHLVNKSMNELMKKKIISYAGKEGKAYLWKNITKIEFKNDLKKLESEHINLKDDKIEAKELKEKISIDKIESFIRTWFNAEIIENELIHYPIYELKFSNKNEVRIVKLSAITGRVM